MIGEMEQPKPPVEDFGALMAGLEAYMTTRFPAYGIVGTRAFCPTGEPYIVLGCDGIKKEGERIRVITTDVEKAIELFKAEFDKFSNGKDGGIYWRRKPDVSVDYHWNALYGGYDAYYRVTARFVISNLPRQATTEEETR